MGRPANKAKVREGEQAKQKQRNGVVYQVRLSLALVPQQPEAVSHQLQARLQIIDAESAVVDRDINRVLKTHKVLNIAAQLAICILRNRVQWDRGAYKT